MVNNGIQNASGSKKTAAEQGSRLLTNVKVQNALEPQMLLNVVVQNALSG